MSLDQQFSARTMHMLRRTVLAHASAAGMTDDRALDLMLAVHELAANTVRHGGGTGRVQMRVTGGEVVCEVSDPGHDGHPHGRGHPSGTAARAQPWPYQPGHGLWLAREAADEITVSSGPAGSQVRIVFVLSVQGVPGDSARAGA